MSDGLSLSYLRWGEAGAPEVLLLHGGGLSADDWQEIAPALAATGRRVTAPDLRGCGESDWDPEDRYGVEQTVADLDELVAELGLETFDLVGHSLGAVTACVYAAERPARVRRCVMEDGGPAGHTRPASLENPPDRVRVDRGGDRGARQGSSARRAGMGSSLPFPEARGRAPDLAKRHRRPRPLVGGGGEPLIPGLWPYVEAMRCPTLVVRGAESPLFTIENAERMTAVNEMIRLVTIPDAGHLVHCEQPAAFLEAVIPFLRGMSALEALIAAYEDPRCRSRAWSATSARTCRAS